MSCECQSCGLSCPVACVWSCSIKYWCHSLHMRGTYWAINHLHLPICEQKEKPLSCVQCCTLALWYQIPIWENNRGFGSVFRVSKNLERPSIWQLTGESLPACIESLWMTRVQNQIVSCCYQNIILKSLGNMRHCEVLLDLLRFISHHIDWSCPLVVYFARQERSVRTRAN